ncbi:thermonuclease family protein [Thermodesulfobacteriota bacterium]
MKRPRRIVMAAVLLLSLAVLAGRMSKLWGPFPRQAISRSSGGTSVEPAWSRAIKVVEVIDGDTIVIDGGEHIRYLGIDTPERGEPLYVEARRENRRLLSSGGVSLRGCPSRPEDKYGRTRAFVWAGETFVNAELVRKGLAKTRFLSSCEDGVARDFVLREIEAWRGQLGLWSGADLEPIDHTEAAGHIGSFRAVTGRVLEVSRGPTATFVNFTKDYENDFTAVVFPRGMAHFKDLGIDLESTYTGRRVRVTGPIGEHNGPQIVVEAPEQISFAAVH